jgi:ADP-ribosylglycohydrolase
LTLTEWNPAGTIHASVIRGALLGAAVGDALGVHVSFQVRSARKSDPVTGLHAFGTQHQPALMRILPVALAYADDPDLVVRASEISSLTHAHERSRFCCAFYCFVASDLMHGGSIETATAFAWDVLNYRWTFSPDERVRFDALHPDRLFARQEDTIRSTGHVIDTLDAALWVNARHDEFSDAVLHAVNLGDDTDTTGCVAGGLAGILHGEGAIPGESIAGLAKREELIEQAERFSDHCKGLRQKGAR